jgi:hypothetical protein
MQIAIVGISRELEACLIVEYTRYKELQVVEQAEINHEQVNRR